MSIPATREWVDAKISKSIRAAVGEGGDKPPKALSEMTDVVVASPSNDQALMWDSTSRMWMNKSVPAGTKNYNDLTNKPSINGTELVGNIEISTKHEYSTEEKVVGKWIDGSDVYEIVSMEKPDNVILINEINTETNYSIYTYLKE